MRHAFTSAVGAATDALRANAQIFAILVLSIATYLPFAPARMADFRAFYCAGKAVAAHADPYREHPLHECERTTRAPGMPPDIDTVTVPAPLPGYALAVFALLGKLPFGASALLWIAASLSAVLATIGLLKRVIELPVAAIAITIVLPAFTVAIPLGQLAPFVGCGIAAAALCLHVGRWRLAALAALTTALAPTIALVLCATLFVAVPASRVTLVVGTAALAGLSILMLGQPVNSEYVRVILHAHALASVAERTQFSATHFAWVVGCSHAGALMIGNVWYGVSALTGVCIACRLRRRYGDAAVALVPPVFAVFGGSYVHFDFVVLAIPAYLLIAKSCAADGPWLRVAIFVLAVPWLAMSAFPPFALALFVCAVAYARDVPFARLGVLLGLASAVLLIAYFAIALATLHAPQAAFHFEAVHNPLADASWGSYIAWRDPKPNALLLLLQMPTLTAFCVCLGVVLRQTRLGAAIHLAPYGSESAKAG